LAEFSRIAVVMIWKINEGRNYTNIGNLDIADIANIIKEASK